MEKRICGKELAQKEKEIVKEIIQDCTRKPRFVIVQVGENPASNTYVKGKIADCKEVGIHVVHRHWPETISEESLICDVQHICENPNIDGIIVQLPLPQHIREQAITSLIPPEKDVDGFSDENMGRLWLNKPCFAPCTPAGCMKILHSTGVPLKGKRAVVVGRSNIVGKPMAAMLLQEDMTVTICHSKTEHLKELCRTADVLVVAVGRPKFITSEYVKPGAVVIDVGINRDESGKLCGDVDYEDVYDTAGFITPVPGGVGLMTRAMLLENVARAAVRRQA